jgi:hypothetical protein
MEIPARSVLPLIAAVDGDQWAANGGRAATERPPPARPASEAGVPPGRQLRRPFGALRVGSPGCPETIVSGHAIMIAMMVTIVVNVTKGMPAQHRSTATGMDLTGLLKTSADAGRAAKGLNAIWEGHSS